MVRLAEQQQQLSCEHVCMLLKRSTAIRHCVHAVCSGRCFSRLIPAPGTGDMCIVRSSVRSDALRERMFTDMWWWVPCCENGPLNYELARSHMNSLSRDLRRRWSMYWTLWREACVPVKCCSSSSNFNLLLPFAADLSKHSQWFLNISKLHSHCPALYSCCVFQ